MAQADITPRSLVSTAIIYVDAANHTCAGNTNTINLTDVDANCSGNATGSSSMQLPQYLYIYLSFFNALIFLIGLVGNLMVIQVVTRMRAMRTRINYFLLSLSVADLLVLTICQPTALMVFYTKDRWVLGEFMCKLTPLLEHGTVHTSALTLVGIGVERYCSVNGPLGVHVVGAGLRRKTWPVIAVIWAAGFLTSVPFVFLTHLEKTEFQDGSVDDSCHTRIRFPVAKAYVCALFAVFFALPLLLLAFMYLSIIRRLFLLTGESATPDSSGLFSSHASRVSRSSRASSGKGARCRGISSKFQNRKMLMRRRVAIMMVAIVCLFFVTMLPLKIFALWVTVFDVREGAGLGFEAFYNVLSSCQLITYVNSAGNPVIYALLSPKFRRAFRQLLPSFSCRQ